MATTTPNNGWTVPTSTDYVKDGATAIETLGDAIDASVGTGLLAWQSWAPTLSGGWLNGNGTWSAYYAQLGKNVFVQMQFTIGSTTTKGTTLTCTLPVTAKRNNKQCFNPMARIGSSIFNLMAEFVGTTTFTTYFDTGTNGQAGSITSAQPATWATADTIQFNFNYEAA